MPARDINAYNIKYYLKNRLYILAKRKLTYPETRLKFKIKRALNEDPNLRSKKIIFSKPDNNLIVDFL